ncbi:MAG TPA: SEC-C metal-binding domain-containing protein, partial [Thermoanaerobaculia bacterium]|nr:SEC-C metal-binding domain-containing protein [Thermoanaerobaculia bacterium]
NDPCPCGSGRKYKQCCLREEREHRSPARWTGSVVKVLDWLQQRHRRSLERARHEFYASLDEERSGRLLQLPEEILSMVDGNSIEWLIAEGEIEVHGERRLAMDLVLGPGGPLLAVEERQWLEGLARHPMQVYEVQEAIPGEGVWVKNVATAKARRVWVRERSASQSLVRWDVLGARLVPVGEEWQISGAIYLIPRDALPGLRAALRVAARAGDNPSRPIIAAWLGHLTEPPPPLPKFVDSSSGDPILMVTDHYDVTSWDELAACLGGQPDVDGNQEKGWVWLEDTPEGRFQRSRLALNPGRENRLEAFARSLRRAEEGAAWLRQVAGDTLVYRTREIVDPTSALLQQRPPSTANQPAPIPLPPEIHRELYRQWPEQPIPALGNLTPREAIRTRSGRQQVVELLKDYEIHEQRSAREQGLEPASFRFLWDELGLSPP